LNFATFRLGEFRDKFYRAWIFVGCNGFLHKILECASEFIIRFAMIAKDDESLGDLTSTGIGDACYRTFRDGRVFEQNLLDHAQEGRGKFRSFLLVTLNNYVISQHRSDSAAKRLPVAGIAELGELAQQVAGGHDPAQSFNVAWAREVIAEALRRMQAECAQSKRGDLWTIFQGRVVRPAFEGEEPVGYESLVSELGLAAPLDACRLLTTAKRMFSRNLRAVASEYAGSDGDTDAEIDDLRQIVAQGTTSSRPAAVRPAGM